MVHEKKICEILKDVPQYKYVPEFDPDGGCIKALTLEGERVGSQKTKIFGYFGLPENISSKVPAVVLVHGGGGHAFHCWVKQWNDRGYAAIAIDTTGFMPKKRNAGCKECDGEDWERTLHGVFYEEGYVCGPDNDGMDIEEKSIEEQWMFHAVSACIKAHSFLRHQKEIDIGKIGVTGVSWGGVITSILIGMDNRFAFAVPTYGTAYLGDSFADIMQNFKKECVKKYWMAESRYDKLNIPVLWLAWNDDSCFSIQSASKSYLHSQSNNENSRLSLVNLMKHSHWHTWQREEPFFFADWCVKAGKAMPMITDMSSKEDICLNITADDEIKIKSASLFYITSPMEYKVYNKFGDQSRSFMSQEWQIMPLAVEGNKAFGKMPENAVGTYKEVVFLIGEKEITVTTEYLEK